MSEPDINQSTGLPIPGEGYHTVSWIWMSPGAGMAESPQMHEALHIEWAKCCARHNHWTKEVALLQEEMHCIPVFLDYMAQQWETCATRCSDLPLALLEGVHTYAFQQSQILHQQVTLFHSTFSLQGLSGQQSSSINNTDIDRGHMSSVHYEGDGHGDNGDNSESDVDGDDEDVWEYHVADEDL
ncbi:hypothetical protein BS47DRAFT_1400285 [Hydnum rufescens UP504]|uniref:Uncharacterized protein n=1 Tax=Hydnum rufescens UP504 TaxID=1448309 RepID=A0A9P6AGS8_9AGAM|nr:hypothetical protein BS47DRAFT_1400285 [Hydnum rufescens UP504]